MHLPNLYKAQEILAFKRCFACEKIHGTSAHIKFNGGNITFFSGGESHENFIKLFDHQKLIEKLSGQNVTVFGEFYGGRCQKAGDLYGKTMKFVAFDVMKPVVNSSVTIINPDKLDVTKLQLMDESWLTVPEADAFVKELGLEFVHYEEIECTMEEINRCRDEQSIQAIRNGCGEGKQREGVVLRPLMELRNKYGERIMCKHKQDKFRETSTPREVSPDKLAVLTEANAIATEWVTPMRVVHVLDKLPGAGMEKMPVIIAAMQEDIKREAKGEIVWSNDVARAIGKETAQKVKQHFQNQLK